MVNLVVRHSNGRASNATGSNALHLSPTGGHHHLHALRSSSPMMMVTPSVKEDEQKLHLQQSQAQRLNSRRPGHVPSPIRVPFRPNARPVSPLTTSESMFAGGPPNLTLHRAQGQEEDVRDPASKTTPMNRTNPHEGAREDPQGAMAYEYGVMGKTEVHTQGHFVSASPPVTAAAVAGSEMAALVSEDDEPVCDYDADVTTLYELLESSRWSQAQMRCRSHPLEVRTWIARRHRWRLLPLHAAVIFQAPADVVTALLETYPAAASKRDDQGMLPLHLAFRHYRQVSSSASHHPQYPLSSNPMVDETLLHVLLEQYPQGVAVRDRRERLPLDHGKDTTFSSHLLQKYAQAHIELANSNSLTGGNADADNLIGEKQREQHPDPIAIHQAAVAEEELAQCRQTIQKQELQVQHLSDRLDLLSADHREQLADKQSSFESQISSIKNLYEERIGQMEREQAAVIEEKTRGLRQQYETLLEHTRDVRAQLQAVCADQRSMHVLCTQQQASLSKAHASQEKLLRRFLEQATTEHSTYRRNTDDILRLSSSIQRDASSMLERQGIPDLDEATGGGDTDADRGTVDAVNQSIRDREDPNSQDDGDDDERLQQALESDVGPPPPPHYPRPTTPKSHKSVNAKSVEKTKLAAVGEAGPSTPIATGSNRRQNRLMSARYRFRRHDLVEEHRQHAVAKEEGKEGDEAEAPSTPTTPRASKDGGGAATPWSAHDDDISAITENSNY